MNWLKNKKTQIILFVSCIISLLISFIIIENSRSVLNIFFAILFVSLVPVSFFSFIYIFQEYISWKRWLKFSSFLSILAAIFIFFASSSSSFGISERGLYVFAYWVIYSLTSIGILIYGFFKKN